ncbi:hypothetical protein GH714_002693 [Hevea brasiliensis]|uniref:Vesicle transport v-SNARE N-terminal domain-containing protein n=1 Tax=Hevea brasiliensis TaxID=3981 RepID=A0A6A6KN21_HEVBR|nr:hypothetical protein GH714_002693 [Hevea brasiliensis]
MRRQLKGRLRPEVREKNAAVRSHPFLKYLRLRWLAFYIRSFLWALTWPLCSNRTSSQSSSSSAIMSDVFEGYERQYCELSANLSQEKKVKISEIKSGLDDCDVLVRFRRSGFRRSRERLSMSVERLNQSGDRINESRRTMLETEELGVSILEDLHQQRQTLLHAHNKLHGVDAIDKSKKVLSSMSRRITRNKWIVGSVIAALVLAIIFIISFKVSHH